MNWTTVTIDVLLFFFVLDCAFMGLVIMMQRSKQEGLGAAFGGGITESVFGAQTSNVLVKATVYAAIIFFTLSILLARLYSHLDVLDQKERANLSPVQQELMKPVTPVQPAPTTPKPTPTAPTPAATAPAAPSPASAPVTAKPATTPAGK